MAKGTVVFFHDQKGYGFIEPEEAATEETAAEESGTESEDDDVFFHMEEVAGPDLEEGDQVEFETEESEKGLRATDVRRA